MPSSAGDGFLGHENIMSSYMSDSGSSESDDFFLDSPSFDGDFSEYMWMENEEEFEQEVSYYQGHYVIGLRYILYIIQSGYAET